MTLAIQLEPSALTIVVTDTGYSTDDIDRLRRITDLLAAGLNLAGIARVLDLEADNAQLRTRLDKHKNR